MMGRLYEISAAYIEALEALEIDEETGEVKGCEAIEALGDQFEQKAESIACYIKDRAAFAADLKAEETNLAERRKSVEKQVERVKTYLTNCMDAVGREKLETAKARVSFRQSKEVQIDDVDLIPEDYLRVTQTVKPDKVAIKKAILDGKAVKGAHLTDKKNLQIK